jgi:hypothetical protein
MPIDTSIYQQPPSQGFNTPFQTLAQVGALQRQRQEIQSSQAEEQLRQQALKDKQQQDEANARFYQVIGNPDVTVDNFLGQVKIHAPEHYEAASKMVDEAKKNAADLAEKAATAQRANAEAQQGQQAYLANMARSIKAAGDTPTAFELAMKIHQYAFPDSKQPDTYRDLVRQQGPQSIAQITSALIAANPAASKQTAEQPEQEATAKSAQLVLAGTSPTGMTANQQAEDANRQATLKQGAERLRLEGQRLSQEDVAPNLTPEAKALVAKQFAMTGQLPPMGMGKAGAKVRTDIINAAADAYKNLDLPSQQAAYKANQASLTVAQKQRDAVGGFEETALKNLDQFLGTAQKVVDTGSPLINKPLRQISSQLLGSPEMAAYNAARLTVIPEFAKILSNPNLTGQLSDSARKEVESLISGDATLAQAVSVAKILKADTANRRTALDDQIKAIQGRIAAPPGGATSTPAAAPQSGGPAIGERRLFNGKVGVWDGKGWKAE